MEIKLTVEQKKQLEQRHRQERNSRICDRINLFGEDIFGLLSAKTRNGYLPSCQRGKKDSDKINKLMGQCREQYQRFKSSTTPFRSKFDQDSGANRTTANAHRFPKA